MNTQRIYTLTYGPYNRSSLLAIRRIVEKFKKYFTLHNAKIPTRDRNARNVDNIGAVRDSVPEARNLSIPRRAQELGIRRSTTWRILQKDLGLHPCKVTSVQEIWHVGIVGPLFFQNEVGYGITVTDGQYRLMLTYVLW